MRTLASSDLGMTFKRSDMRGRLTTEELRVLDNFLDKMKRLDVIRSDPEGGPGAYQFQNHLHYLYFFFEADRAEKSTEA